jgi:outer membrane protein assembly factor BamD
MIKNTGIALVFFVAIVLGACSNYQKLLKSTDNDAKYEAAMDYYEKGDYTRAIQLFDLLQAFYRGDSRGELLSYRTAYAYYNMEDYIVASFYFKRHVRTYPQSKETEEAAYMAAYCYYLDSPRYSLDQSNTYEAIRELQSFIDTYPGSDRVQKANELVDDLRKKLEKKDYNIALMYYRMRDYMAAIKMFENVLKRFPDTERREEIFYYMTLSYFEFAEQSIPERRRERFESAIEAFNTLLYQYPESKFLDELASVNEKARERIIN